MDDASADSTEVVALRSNGLVGSALHLAAHRGAPGVAFVRVNRRQF